MSFRYILDIWNQFETVRSEVQLNPAYILDLNDLLSLKRQPLVKKKYTSTCF